MWQKWTHNSWEVVCAKTGILIEDTISLLKFVWRIKRSTPYGCRMRFRIARPYWNTLWHCFSAGCKRVQNKTLKFYLKFIFCFTYGEHTHTHTHTCMNAYIKDNNLVYLMEKEKRDWNLFSCPILMPLI